jgi:AraC-like DNA-binding protein
VRLSRICALRGESSPLICDGRLSSTPPSCGDFIRTTIAERDRILECAQWCDPHGWSRTALRKAQCANQARPDQLVVRREKDESANMARARQFIEKHQAEPLSLARVAQAANISRHYFCKMFKKGTGINFIDYLSRVRVEKSKALLLNPNSRISEAAFASGFQSMTNFNRAFRQIVGRSPTKFRNSLPKLRGAIRMANG